MSRSSARLPGRGLIRAPPDATTILCTLGEGDAGTISALLSAASDTSVVADAALTAARWIQPVDEDGMVLLIDAVAGPRAGDAATAALTLASLARQGALDVERGEPPASSPRRPGEAAGQRWIVERDPAIADTGRSPGPLARRLRCSRPAGPARERRPATLTHRPGTRGKASCTISRGRLPQSPIKFQADVLESERTPVEWRFQRPQSLASSAEPARSWSPCSPNSTQTPNR